MMGDTSHLVAKTIGAEIAEVWRRLVRERLKAAVMAEVEAVIDECLKDIPAEVQAMLLHDHINPLGQPIARVHVTAGRKA